MGEVSAELEELMRRQLEAANRGDFAEAQRLGAKAFARWVDDAIVAEILERLRKEQDG